MDVVNVGNIAFSEYVLNRIGHGVFLRWLLVHFGGMCDTDG